MKDSIEKQGCRPEVTGQQNVDLGRWMGRHEAFATISGGCAAADIESLRRIRDQKLYLAVARNWDEFCSVHLRVSRRKVEMHIGYLTEFGGPFFLLRQLMHITPDQYRAIAPHVGPEGVRTSAGIVALLPEKSEEVSAAVAELLKESKKTAGPREASFQPILRHCESAVRLLENYDLRAAEKLELTAILTRLWQMTGHQCLTLK